MKAQVINAFGEPAVFQLVDLPQPTIKPGYVLIRVGATSVNPVDYKIRSGAGSALAADFPAILHGDVAGVVEAVGEGVTDIKKGDAVFGCAGGVKGESGALAEYMLADARLLAKKTANVTFAEAAALPLVSLTVWEALFDKLNLQRGQTILIHGAAGGVGHIAVQLAKWAGATVHATVSSEEKSDLVKKLGADEIINYRNEAVADYVKRLTNGKGYDLIFDTVGGDNIATSIEALAYYGHLATIQANAMLDLAALKSKSGSLHVVFMLLPLLFNQQRERHGIILNKIAELVDAGVLKPALFPQQFSLNEVAKAHALAASGNIFGKVVIQINQELV